VQFRGFRRLSGKKIKKIKNKVTKKLKKIKNKVTKKFPSLAKPVGGRAERRVYLRTSLIRVHC
jgi:hypothetical protein